MIRRFVLAGLVLALAAAGPVRPAEPGSRLDRLHAEIDLLAGERQRLAAEERGIIGRIETLGADARLLDAKLEALTVERAQLEDAVRSTDRRAADLASRLEAGRRRLRGTVRLLYQSGPLGNLRFVLGGGDTGQLASGWRLAQELTVRQREDIVRIRTDEAELVRVRQDGDGKRRELAAAIAQAATARAELTAAIRERQDLLRGVRAQEAQRREAIDELQRASQELGQMLGPGSTGSFALDIRRFRGLLGMPARGGVAEGFGERRDPRFGTVIPHHGWDIGAPFGEEVRAVFDGRVVWAAWFKGYGLMVVLDHGHGVHSVYAHLSLVAVSKGQEIARGQVLGRVGDTGSLSGPQLYFEIRDGGKAQDPAEWIDKRRAS